MQKLEARQRRILQVGADNGNVGEVLLYCLYCFGEILRSGYNVEVVPTALQRGRNQLTTHSSGFGNQNPDMRPLC